MTKPTDQLIRIVSAGGNVIIPSKPTDQLIRIVSAAKASGAHITLKGNKPTDQLVRIANSADGHFTIDFTD